MLGSAGESLKSSFLRLQSRGSSPSDISGAIGPSVVVDRQATRRCLAFGSSGPLLVLSTFADRCRDHVAHASALNMQWYACATEITSGIAEMLYLSLVTNWQAMKSSQFPNFLDFPSAKNYTLDA
jgi:hypothetical protein